MRDAKDPCAQEELAGPTEADAVGCVVALLLVTTAPALVLWIVRLMGL